MTNTSDLALGNETESLRECIERSPVLWEELKNKPGQFRVLTGERTTGALHIGHYFGSLKSRVTLQNWGVDMFLILADYQAITDRNSTEKLKMDKAYVWDVLRAGNKKANEIADQTMHDLKKAMHMLYY